MLRTLPENQKSRWKDHVNKVVQAYNCTRNNTTGYSPFFLLFGWQPQLQIDLLLDPNLVTTSNTYPQYVSEWKNAKHEAYQLAGRKRKVIKRINTTIVGYGILYYSPAIDYWYGTWVNVASWKVEIILGKGHSHCCAKKECGKSRLRG
jgi:hypothetical protein